MKHLLSTLLILNTLYAHAGQVDTVEIFSVAMQKPVRCLVIRPENYHFTGERYPVLYLLHGWSGNYAGWLGDAPQLREHADRYRMLIVCPDGGYDSWYIDSPVDSTVRYETHIASEVVQYVDYYYYTRQEPGGRAIAGLSMGGHGALSLAIRHPEVFGAAGSMAGGVDLRPWKKNNWDLEGVLGNPLLHPENWEHYSVVNLVNRLQKSKQQLIIDCGDGDFFIDGNRLLHQLLLAMKYPHEYTERPGEHNDDYWGRAVDFQVLFFDRFFSGE